MKKKISRDYLLFLVFFYFFIFKDILESKISAIGYADEFLILLAVPFSIYEICKNRFIIRISLRNWWVYLIGFLTVGFLGNLFFEYQPLIKVAFPDMFLCVKFWMGIYVGQILFKRLNLREYGKRIYGHVKFITWIYTGLVVLDYAFKIFPTTERYGLRPTILFYWHQTIFAAECVFLLAILFSVRPYVKCCDRYFVILIILLCTTLRSKAFGAALFFVYIYYLVFIRKKAIKIRTILMMVPIVILIAWEQIQFYFFSSIQNDSARYQLLTKGGQIAMDHFPLGAGFGTFGSYISAVQYSPLYYKYHISQVFGLTKGSAYFVSDSFWPMILGQTGWIGMLFMGLALFCLFLRIQKLKSQNASHYVAGIIVLSYLVIASMAESAFVHPISIPLAIWLGVILRKEEQKERIKL